MKIKSAKGYMIVASLFVFSVVALGNINLVNHEAAHKRICEEAFGNASVSYSYSLFPPEMKGRTYCDSWESEAINKKEALDLQNEIFGYNVKSIYLSILAGSFMIAMAIVYSGGDRNKIWNNY